MEKSVSCLVLLVVALAIDAIMAYLIMLLWNFVVPQLFDGPTIGFWHAAALMFLVSLLGGMIGKKD